MFVALGSLRAMRMRRNAICPDTSVKYFPTLSHKRHDFRGNKLLKLRYVLIFSTNLKQFWFWKKMSEILSFMYIGLHVKHPLFVSHFNQIWIFSTDFRKALKHGTSRKSDRRTDRHDETSKFSFFFPNFFCKRPNVNKIHCSYGGVTLCNQSATRFDPAASLIVS